MTAVCYLLIRRSSRSTCKAARAFHGIRFTSYLYEAVALQLSHHNFLRNMNVRPDRSHQCSNRLETHLARRGSPHRKNRVAPLRNTMRCRASHHVPQLRRRGAGPVADDISGVSWCCAATKHASRHHARRQTGTKLMSRHHTKQADCFAHAGARADTHAACTLCGDSACRALQCVFAARDPHRMGILTCGRHAQVLRGA